MSLKIYWAAPLFVPSQIEVGDKVVSWLRSEGHEVFVPKEASAEIWKGRPPAQCTDDERQQVFEGNYENVAWADVLIAWAGGMDEMTRKRELALADAVDHLIGEHGHEIPRFHRDELVKALAIPEKAASTDTGVTWEMGFGFGWNYASEYVRTITESTDILVYIDDSDQRQSMNLMLERAVTSVARGFEDLKQQITSFSSTGDFGGSKDLTPEQDPVA